jgi:hypothetical protein
VIQGRDVVPLSAEINCEHKTNSESKSKHRQQFDSFVTVLFVVFVRSASVLDLKCFDAGSLVELSRTGSS